jgi:hypothetical protein
LSTAGSVALANSHCPAWRLVLGSSSRAGHGPATRHRIRGRKKLYDRTRPPAQGEKCRSGCQLCRARGAAARAREGSRQPKRLPTPAQNVFDSPGSRARIRTTSSTVSREATSPGPPGTPSSCVRAPRRYAFAAAARVFAFPLSAREVHHDRHDQERTHRRSRWSSN